MAKKILITGGAGFIGANLAIQIKKKYPNYSIFCLDNLKRRGSELNIRRLADEGIVFTHGDIRNREDFYPFEDGLDTIIEASAEPSVMAGLGNAPDYLVNTNLLGTMNCLYLAAKLKSDFIFLSTSRVYPIENIELLDFEESETRFELLENQETGGASQQGISEKFSLEGFRSLYGATKLASEFLIGEFNKYYRIRTVINRCGVISGPWQMGKVDQGVVVLWVACHYWKKDLCYFGYGGKGKQVRDVLHVDDLFRLIDFQLHNMDKLNGQLFNVGGGKDMSISLKELTTICEKLTGNMVKITEVPEGREADIRVYITDNSRIYKATGWQPEASVEQIVSDVYRWIKENEQLLRPILAG
jgi:CDP-paratose 2-epimerase